VSAEDLKDWDDRFWEPTTDLCLECMPAGLAAEVRQMFANTADPIGHTGRDSCAKCGRSRLAALRALPRRAS
jgi:hypothetical protein